MSRPLQILFGVLIVAAAGESLAEGIVTLKDEVYVKGPTVLLGDIANVEGTDAEALESIEIAPAAVPGGGRSLHAALVRSRIDQAGLESKEIEFKGSPRTVAKTLYLEITPGMIAEDLRTHIESHMAWDPNAAYIEITPPPGEYRVSDGDVSFRWQSNPRYNYLGVGSFRGEILVDGRVEKSILAKAEVEAYDEVVIATRELRRGDRLSSHNIATEPRALSDLDDSVFFDSDEVSGYVARVTIRQGQPITSQKIEAPILVKRNQIVDVETRIGALTIRARARAMDDGSAGDNITLRSLESRDEFPGTVRADGTVVVD